MPHVDWKFILANSSDLSGIADLTNNARDKQLQLTLNRSGSFNCNIPITYTFANNIVPVAKCIKIYKNDNLIWSGPIWRIEESLPENTISVGAVGWFEFLNKRYLDADITYPSSTNRGEIALDLLSKANAQQETYITVGTNTSDAIFSFNRTYNRFQNIGQEIIALSEIENGFDWEINPETRNFNIYSTKMTDHTNIVFGYNFGPNNVANVKRTTDADNMANRIIATGKFSNAQTDDVSAQNTYRLFTRIDSLSEVADNEVLGAWVNAEIALNKNPRVIYSFTPFSASEKGNVPKLFEDYNIGDKVYLTAKYGNIQVTNQAIRVFGATVSIDNEGNERLSEIQSTAS